MQKKPITPAMKAKLKELAKQMVRKPSDPQKQLFANALRKGK